MNENTARFLSGIFCLGYTFYATNRGYYLFKKLGETKLIFAWKDTKLDFIVPTNRIPPARFHQRW